MSEKNYCTICQSEREGKYCSNCGQKIEVTKTGLTTLITDFYHNIFSFQKSVISTLIDLLKSPSKVVNNYALGYRGYYRSPGNILLFLLTLTAVHFIFIDQAVFGMQVSFRSEEIQGHFTFLLIIIFVISITSYLYYLKVKASYVKHLISVIYLSFTFYIILLILSDVLSFFIADLEFYFLLLLILFVIIWNSIVFLTNKNFWNVFLHSFLHLLVLVGFLLIFGIVLIITGVVEVVN